MNIVSLDEAPFNQLSIEDFFVDPGRTIHQIYFQRVETIVRNAEPRLYHLNEPLSLTFREQISKRTQVLILWGLNFLRQFDLDDKEKIEVFLKCFEIGMNGFATNESQQNSIKRWFSTPIQLNSLFTLLMEKIKKGDYPKEFYPNRSCIVLLLSNFFPDQIQYSETLHWPDFYVYLHLMSQLDGLAELSFDTLNAIYGIG